MGAVRRRVGVDGITGATANRLSFAAGGTADAEIKNAGLFDLSLAPQITSVEDHLNAGRSPCREIGSSELRVSGIQNYDG